jgi:hypothetical protein
MRIARSWLEVASFLLLCISLDADLGIALAANDADHPECVLAASSTPAMDERLTVLRAPVDGIVQQRLAIHSARWSSRRIRLLSPFRVMLS